MKGRSAAKWMAVLVPLLLGIGLIVAAVSLRDEPERRSDGETATTVSVVEAPALAVRAAAYGYGSAVPGRTWQGVAEVDGRVVHRHPDLERGEILAGGEVLLRIDPEDYESAVRELEGAVAANEARLAELEVQEAYTRTELETEQERLSLALRELQRLRRLAEQRNVSESDVDRQEASYLDARQAVQRLEETLERIPSQRRGIQAALQQDRARLEKSRRDLERTVIRAPFDMRIADVRIEQGQYALQGSLLVEGDGIDSAEVTAQVPVTAFRTVLQGATPSAGRLPSFDVLGPLDAVVELPAAGGSVRWSGRVVRISDTIDPKTRTVGVVVVVDEPYARADPPLRPPLVKGMFVEVAIAGPPRAGTVVVPRSAVRQGDRLHVVDAEGRLEIREVELAWEQRDIAAIAAGLSAGERVVTTDLVPAIEGMLLAPMADEDAADRLRLAATGIGAEP